MSWIAIRKQKIVRGNIGKTLKNYTKTFSSSFNTHIYSFDLWKTLFPSEKGENRR